MYMLHRHTSVLYTHTNTQYIYIYIYNICTHSKNCFIRNRITGKFRLTGKLTKVKLTLEQAMKAQRRSKGIALLFVNLGATSGWVVNTSVNEHLKTVGIYL